MEHILKIGGVRHQKGAVKNGGVLLGFAVHKIAVPGKRRDGARILQKRNARRQQHQAAHGAAQQRFKSQRAEPAHTQLVCPGGDHGKKVDDQKNRLPGEKEVVVQQVDGDPEGERAASAVQHGGVQRRQHKRKQRYNVNKMVEKDVVHRKPAKGVQHGGNHAPVVHTEPAPRPQVRAAARHGKFYAEQRHQHIGHKLRRYEKTQPEKRAAQQVERVGVHKPGAQIGFPAVAAALLEKAVGVLVKIDLLVVKIPGVVEVPAAPDSVDQAVRQKQQRCQQKADAEHLPKAVFGF